MTSVRLLLDCLTLARVALRPVGVGALLVGLGGAPGRAVVHIRAAVVGPTLHLWIYPFSIYLFYPSLIFYPWPYRRRAACTSWRPAPRCSLLRSWARPRPGSRPPPRATAASSLLRTPRTNPRHVTRLQVEQFYWYLLYLPSDRAPDTDLPETNVIIPSV